MKINKIMKIIVALLLISLLTITFAQFAFADADTIKPTSANLDDWMNQEDTTGTGEAARTIISQVINVAQIIGVGVAILMLIVLAIKYVAASPEGKAEIKKNATVYIVGAVLLFAAAGILGIIRKFAANIDNAGK